MTKRSPYKTLINKLDRLCAEYIKLRDNNMCQKCGKTAPYIKLDWSHVITRGNKRLRWNPANSKSLCANCHRFFWHHSPMEAYEWFIRKFPDRWKTIEQERLKGPKKWTIEEMEEMIFLFEKDIKKLKNESEFLAF